MRASSRLQEDRTSRRAGGLRIGRPAGGLRTDGQGVVVEGVWAVDRIGHVGDGHGDGGSGMARVTVVGIGKRDVSILVLFARYDDAPCPYSNLDPEESYYKMHEEERKHKKPERNTLRLRPNKLGTVLVQHRSGIPEHGLELCAVGLDCIINLEGPAFELLKKRFRNNIELEYNMEQCHLTLIDRIDWTNPEEYLRHMNEYKKYSLLVTKIKVARYKQEGIKEMIPHLWSSSIYKYIRNAELNIHHLRENRQWFYKGSIRHKSAHDVYSKLKIISVKKITVEKKYGYSDGTLNKVYNKLDVMLRDNRLGFGNKGMTYLKWTRKDIDRTKSILERLRRSLRKDEGLEGSRALLEEGKSRPTTYC
uniref:Uncharacterized protein n=1 Tax=Tanacetum cinerariifolium TaxID=118510 RepID=A0A6L2MW25_TANCI|nr:hypothetical protein [Tanacetum cinerariifolium]